MIRTYNYEMGFAVDGIPIPDPSSYSGAVSDLDSEGGRDMTGSLHRNMVASSKKPLKIGYDAIDWEMIQFILEQLKGKEFFTFVFPDPEHAGALAVMTAYVGDREWDVKVIMQNQERTYVGSLEFSIIPK